MLSWLPAAPVSLADAKKLAVMFCPELTFADDLLTTLVTKAEGSVRRVVVNLANVRDTALIEGWDQADLALWGNREFYLGAPRQQRARG